MYINLRAGEPTLWPLLPGDLRTPSYPRGASGAPGGASPRRL